MCAKPCSFYHNRLPKAPTHVLEHVTSHVWMPEVVLHCDILKYVGYWLLGKGALQPCDNRDDPVQQRGSCTLMLLKTESATSYSAVVNNSRLFHMCAASV